MIEETQVYTTYFLHHYFVSAIDSGNKVQPTMYRQCKALDQWTLEQILINILILFQESRWIVPCVLQNGTPTTRYLDLKDVVEAGMMTSGRRETSSFPSTFNHLPVARARLPLPLVTVSDSRYVGVSIRVNHFSCSVIHATVKTRIWPFCQCFLPSDRMKVRYVFPVRGHCFLPADRVFATGLRQNIASPRECTCVQRWLVTFETRCSYIKRHNALAHMLIIHHQDGHAVMYC